jgi:hypothetical protein
MLNAILFLFCAVPGYAFEEVRGRESCNSCHEDIQYWTDWHKKHMFPFLCFTCHDRPEGEDLRTASCAKCHLELPCTHDSNPATEGTCYTCHPNCETTGGTDICPATAILGQEDPRLLTLRQFRDEILSRNAAGKAMIRIYNVLGGTLTRVCESHPIVKKYAKSVLETLIPMIEDSLSDEHK